MLVRTMFCKALGVRITAVLTVLALAAGLSLGAAQADTLRVGMDTPVQLDPAFASTDAEILVMNVIYDYLVDIGADNNIRPRLATDWTTSDDGLTYTFTLADGVTFHDGSPLTAQDVVWTFERLRDPALELPTADLYSNIASIEATGDNEVTFMLSATNPFFLYDLSDNHALILKEGTEDPATAFNGTGPFVVETYSPEDRMDLTANETYFIEGKPGVANLSLVFFSDEVASVDALRGGQTDISINMPTSLFETLQNTPGIEAVSVPSNGFDLVRLRADRAPGDDPRVMQAMRLAINRDQIFNVVKLGVGALGQDSPIGPLYQRYYDSELSVPEQNVEQAQALLAEAGYGDGLSLELHTPDTGDRPDLAVVLKELLAQVGIEVEVIVEPESVYYGENGWLDVDFGITGWGSRPIPQFYLDVMVACDAQWNEAHWCDEEVDALIETAGTTLDDDERAQAYADIQRIMLERGPILIPYFFAETAATSDAVEGFDLNAFVGRTDLAAVTLNE